MGILGSHRTPATGLVLFALAVTALVWCRTRADVPGVRGDVPPEVVERATIARQHMERIRMAVLVYMNDHNDQPPPRLSALYPRWIDDPLVFWHPGDSDPPPTTIDNDVPNAPNSALISFDVDFSSGSNWPGNHAYIRDNSAANNDGLFINENWGVWYTDPPGMMPWPTATAVARQNLRGLVMAIRVYSNDSFGWWPTDLMQLVPDVGPSEYARRAFWHPGDDQPMPTAITNSALNVLDSAQISFEYLVAGLNENYYDPNLPFFRDNSPSNNGGLGTLIAHADGRVEYQPLCPGDATADLRVDFDDFVRLADSLGAFQTALPLQGDLNADSNADLLDVALLQLHFGDTCVN